MKRVIFNQKGGVGKTSISCNLATCFGMSGRRTLLIDLDAQMNASQYLIPNYSEHSGFKTIYDYFEQGLSHFSFSSTALAECVFKTSYDNLWVIPSHTRLFQIQAKLESKLKVYKLKKALDHLIETHEFDEVIIDTPPSLNFFSMSALIAADTVLIPFDCDAFSAGGVDQVYHTIEEIAEDYNPGLKVEGIIINQFQKNASLPLEMVQSLDKKGYPILEPYISNSIVLKESHQKRVPIVHLKKRHKITQEFQTLSKNLQ